MIEMELVGVRVELPASAPIVLLRESTDRGLFLPIFVGSAEATSIALAMDQVEPPRPITHDLLVLVIQNLDAELQRVVVTEIKDKTFFAEDCPITYVSKKSNISDGLGTSFEDLSNEVLLSSFIISVHKSTHSSQINTFGPAISFFTSC